MTRLLVLLVLVASMAQAQTERIKDVVGNDRDVYINISSGRTTILTETSAVIVGTKDSLRDVAAVSAGGAGAASAATKDSLRAVAAVVPTWFKITSSATIAIPTGVLGTADTLKLVSSAYSWIKIRGKSGSTDSVTWITGGVSGQLYIFSAVADDTTIHINDGGNIKASAQIVLDALTDRITFFFDGTNFIQIAPVSNND